MSLADLVQLCDGAIPALNGDGTITGRFSMSALAAGLAALPDSEELLPGLSELAADLGGRIGQHVTYGVIRTAFLIEPVVLPAAKTTRFKTRWGLPGEDPRWASPEDCLATARVIIGQLGELAGDAQGRLILEGLAKRSMVAYELPVGYRERRLPIHRADNFVVFPEELLRHVAGFRLLLLDPENPLHGVFTEAYGKISVKTYLTDRALTGSHKSNREKRWEAHPDSVQFALRDTCLAIELVLVNEMCHFEGFPEDLHALLAREDLLLPTETPARCPVTLLPLSFQEFADEVMAPEQGRSAFQVGHLDPLKVEGNVWTNGHRPDNIGWISASGNRIQGSLSAEETREMLKRIWRAYAEAGLLDE